MICVRDKSVTLSGTCPGLCRKVGVMEFGLYVAVSQRPVSLQSTTSYTSVFGCRQKVLTDGVRAVERTAISLVKPSSHGPRM